MDHVTSRIYVTKSAGFFYIAEALQLSFLRSCLELRHKILIAEHSNSFIYTIMQYQKSINFVSVVFLVALHISERKIASSNKPYKISK